MLLLCTGYYWSSWLSLLLWFCVIDVFFAVMTHVPYCLKQNPVALLSVSLSVYIAHAWQESPIVNWTWSIFSLTPPRSKSPTKNCQVCRWQQCGLRLIITAHLSCHSVLVQVLSSFKKNIKARKEIWELSETSLGNNFSTNVLLCGCKCMSVYCVGMGTVDYLSNYC